VPAIPGLPLNRRCLLFELGRLKLEMLLLVYQIGGLLHDPAAEEPEDAGEHRQTKRERDRRRIVRQPFRRGSFGEEKILGVRAGCSTAPCIASSSASL